MRGKCTGLPKSLLAGHELSCHEGLEKGKGLGEVKLIFHQSNIYFPIVQRPNICYIKSQF